MNTDKHRFAKIVVGVIAVLLVLRGQERITRRAVMGAAMVVGGVVVIGVSNT